MEIRELLRLNVGILLFNENSKQVAPIAGELDEPEIVAFKGECVIVLVTAQTGLRAGKKERREWSLKNVRLALEDEITRYLT